MGNIEHSYEIKVCPKCGQQTDRWCYEHGLDMYRGRAVEVVRADAYRGAVEALRAIAADPQLGGTGHPVDVLARTALEALGLDPTGGQS
jgi:hypothetical protein